MYVSQACELPEDEWVYKQDDVVEPVTNFFKYCRLNGELRIEEINELLDSGFRPISEFVDREKVFKNL